MVAVASRRFGTLRELVIDGLEVEQVWVQIGLANDFMSPFLDKSVAKACTGEINFCLLEQGNEYEESDRLEQEEEVDGEGKVRNVDFFDAGEMERFVKQAESRQGDEDDELNLFGGGAAHEESVYNYDDFFGQEQAAADDEFDFVGLSVFENRGKEIARQVETIEQKLVEDKHWALGGEVTKIMRPENSLLDSFLDFDHVAQGTPVLTEEHTQRIETIVRKRALEGTFDDVVRRIEGVKKWAPGTRAELQFGKNEKGLGEVFEEAYVKATAESLEQVARPEHGEAHSLFRDLCLALDALTNDHYRPSAPSAEDLTVRSKDVAAVALEEVAPIGASGAVLLAPEEMAGKLESQRKRPRTKKRQLERERQPNSSGGKQFAKSANFFRNLQEGEKVRRAKPSAQADAAKYKL